MDAVSLLMLQMFGPGKPPRSDAYKTGFEYALLGCKVGPLEARYLPGTAERDAALFGYSEGESLNEIRYGYLFGDLPENGQQMRLL